jgi:DNA-directed RNA polymerase subunit RPC12/RpoP
MDKEKANDVQYVVTCTYCGTQTGLSTKQLEENRPLKCRVCGAPLKIVPPPKRPAPKGEKRSSGYYALHAERTEYERRLDQRYRKAEDVARIVVVAAGAVVLIFIWVMTKC